MKQSVKIWVIFVASGWLAASSSFAVFINQRILGVDFGSGPVETDSGPWQEMSATTAPVTDLGLPGPSGDSQAQQTFTTLVGDVTLTFQENAIGNDNNLGYTDRGTPADGGVLTLGEVYRDFIGINNVGMRLTLSGLAPSTLYNMNFYSFDSVNGYASASATPNTGTTYTLVDGTGAPAFTQILWNFSPTGIDPVYPTSNSMYMTSVAWTSTVSGTLVMDIGRNNSQGPRLNALEMSTLVQIPEPASTLLLTLGGLIMWRWTRRTGR